MPRPAAHALDALARIIVDDAEAACRREEDRARNEARRVVLEAEDQIEALRRASHALGRTRGEAADAARAREADREIEAVRARALDALVERFEQRLLMRLQDLPKGDGYLRTLDHWARVAAASMDRPADVFTARRDRPAVYDALLSAGAEDFHVRVDHDVHVGFVVRDLDGRTLADCRPEALLAAARDDLRALLASRIPAFDASTEAAPAPETASP